MFNDYDSSRIDIGQKISVDYNDTQLKEMAEDIKEPINELKEIYLKDQKKSSRISIATLIVAILTLIATLVGILLEIR